MTNQEALTKVVAHAKAQKEPARGDDGMCRYWLPDGRRCFLGALLSEKEAMTATHLGVAAGAVADELGLDVDFAVALVEVHDKQDPEDWERKLERLATWWDLRMPGEGA